MSAQVAQDLRAAVEVLRRDGWVQQWHQQPDGCRRCASGAVAFVASDGRTSQPGILGDTEYDRWATAAARFRQTVRDDSIVNYNDAPGRTADEVIAALLAAADAAEQVTT